MQLHFTEIVILISIHNHLRDKNHAQLACNINKVVNSSLAYHQPNRKD